MLPRPYARTCSFRARPRRVVATECAPFGRVSRRRWGVSESRIERDPPREPVGSGRARGWQVSLRDVSPCADGFLWTVEFRASAVYLRTLSPTCSSSRDEERCLRCDKLRATPVFCVQWPRHARILHGNSAVDVPETPCFVRVHPHRPHAPGTTRNPAAKTCESGQRSRHPKSKAHDLFQSGLHPCTLTARGCVVAAIGCRGCHLRLEPVPSVPM